MTPLTDLEIIYRLMLAAAIGGIIGAERELRLKPAGFRTNMLIALGSALFTIMSIRLAGTPAEQARVASNIVTGIGFLGAGAIMRDNEGVHGITTAATVWVNAALGVAAGHGDYRIAIVAALITLAVLLLLGPLEGVMDKRLAARTRHMTER